MNRLRLFEVTHCPQNQSSWDQAALSLNCPLDKHQHNTYHCVPNQHKTSLVEFCYNGLVGRFPKGYCLHLSTTKFLNNDNCKGIIPGCPNESYLSNEIFKYPECQNINTLGRCFVADFNCPNVSSQTTDTTSPYLSTGFSKNKSMFTIDRTSIRNVTDKQVIETAAVAGIVIGIAVLIVLILLMLLVIVWKLRKRAKHKNCNEHTQKHFELEENASLLNDSSLSSDVVARPENPRIDKDMKDDGELSPVEIDKEIGKVNKCNHNQTKIEMQKKTNELLELMNTNLENVSDVVVQIKEFLEVKDERWLQKRTYQSEEPVFDDIRNELKKFNNEINYDTLSPTDLLKKASGGLLMRGIFLSKFTDFKKTRGTLVQIKSSNCVDFRSPMITECDYVFDYDNNNQKDTFYKNLQTFGFRTAMKGGVTGLPRSFYTSVGASLGEGLETEIHFETSKYEHNTMIGRISCFVVPVACWESQINMLEVSRDAILDLQKIDTLLTVKKLEEAEQKCLHFFENFGSHFIVGDVHFGGIDKCEAQYASRKEIDKESIKQIVQSTFYNSFQRKGKGFKKHCRNVVSSLDVSIAFAEMKDEYEEKESKNVQISESKVGGPVSVDIPSLWKKGLHACNHTWAVIDRDELNLKNFVGIWMLIMDTKNEFRDAIKFATFLKNVWEKNSGIKSDDNLFGEILRRARFKMQISIEEKVEKAKQDKTSKTFLKILKELLKEVEACGNDMGDNSVWCEEIKENNNIEQLFHMLVTVEVSELDDIEMKKMVKCLLEKGENPTSDNFSEVWHWLDGKNASENHVMFSKMPLNKIEHLLNAVEAKYLKHKELQGEGTYSVTELETNTTNEIAAAITRLQNTLIQTNHCHYLMLIALIVKLKFDIEHSLIRKKMTVVELEYFVSHSKKEMVEYNNLKFYSLMKTEAWLFCKIITNANESSVSSKGIENEFLTKLISHLKQQHLSIDQKIKLLVFERDVMDWDIVLNVLTSFLDDEPKDQNNKTISWNYFENKSDQFFRNVKDKNDQQRRKSIQCDEIDEIPTPVRTILNILDIVQFFPEKLTIHAVTALRDDMFEEAAKITDIPLVMIRKIMSLNTGFREKVLENFIHREWRASRGDEDMLEIKTSVSTCTIDDLHPMDVFMAVFYCCDSFLKRLMIEKMTMCQLAIPLVYENLIEKKLILSLWPIRQIYLNGSSKSVADQRLKIVSFIRIGKKSLKSKSKLINEIIRNGKHDTFFHKHCSLGGRRRKISNGLIEMSYYSPIELLKERKKRKIDEKNIAQEPFAILNLRGDASEYREQTNILLEYSSLIVVLVKRDSLNESCYLKIMKGLHQSNAIVILVSDIESSGDFQSLLESYVDKTQMQKEKTKIISTFNIHKESEFNESDFLCIMRRGIHDALEKSSKEICIADMFKNDFVESDENSTSCENALHLSENVFNMMTTLDNTIDQKGVFLPLQGETLWQKWSQLQKEQNRCGNKDCRVTGESIEGFMKYIREKQIEHCNKAPRPIAMFCEMLVENIYDDELLVFFIAWLKLKLDKQYSAIIPELRQKYNEKCKLYEEKKPSEGCDISQLKSEVDAERKLSNASLGLEHFFREMGQIYESFLYCRDDLSFSIKDKTMFILEKLPLVAAKLLLLGQPLEIMDGDAANVPLKWLKNVFNQVELLLNKEDGGEQKKFFCVSVLGIQSSGKSTLLNTMFGLQSAVRAGRCTRGIFFQLVRVDCNLSSLPFDFVLVIETEGLRAPDLAGEKKHHDNELATLAIGLSDIAIINVKGETIADMQDILRIVVHGLMKLKQANRNLDLSQTGIFIHQNVSARNAKEKMILANQKTVDYLDKITVDIAQQEKISGVLSFRDVIGFNPLDHIKYIPNLWHGSPPMAPASFMYSEEVTGITKLIMKDIFPKRNRYHSLLNTFLHIESLWNGILAEDYVFSFRNCVEK